MDWRTLLHELWECRTRMEVDYNWEPVSRIAWDERFVAAERERAARLKQQHRERGIEPVKAETKLKLTIARPDSHNALTAQVRSHRKFHYRMKGLVRTEEMVANETVILRMTTSGWKITGVHPAAEGAFPSGPAQRMMEQLAQPGNRESSHWLAGKSAPLLHQAAAVPGGYVRPDSIRYNRERAREYADKWWNSANPDYLHFDVDCTNFVSQCIFAGGAPMNYTGKRETGWWYRGKDGTREWWSFSWAVAHALQVYLSGKRTSGLRAEAVESPDRLAVGDVICYSWNGDGRFGHTTIVTGFDENRMPLVHAHTANSRYRYWDYRNSYAWTERTQYRFFHIPDLL